MLSFQNPLAFLFLLLIPLLYILRYFKIFEQIKFFAVLNDWNGKSFEWSGKWYNFLYVFSKVLTILGCICVIVAMADPVIKIQEKVYTSLGTDIVFVVDTSPSMAAQDMNGNNRLAAAQSAINFLVSQHDGYRYGIVVLGSEASVLVPPTSDFTYFKNRIDELKIGYFGNGSAIGDGIGTAFCHLASSKAPKKCIILLTDGENNAGDIHPETAANLAASNQIALYVVGVGSKGTVPIEYVDPLSGKLYSGYLNSNFDSSSLKQIASIGNGLYYEVQTIEELNSALSVVVKNENVQQNYTYKSVNELLYKNVLLLSFILFAITFVIKKLLLREGFY